MSFVEKFYSFQLEISHADQGRHAALRIKTPRHPYESLEFLYARMLAFVHSYEPQLSFSQGLYNTDEPTIWKRDSVGALRRWIEVGPVDPKKLKSALRDFERVGIPPSVQVYLYEPEQLEYLCQALRGSKTNWISEVQFYWLSRKTLAALCETERSSARWLVTLVDHSAYLSCDGQDIETVIESIDLWAEYQKSIKNN